MNQFIKRELKNGKRSDSDFAFAFRIQADTIPRKLVLTTSNFIQFTPELNNVQRFTNIDYSLGTPDQKNHF